MTLTYPKRRIITAWSCVLITEYNPYSKVVVAKQDTHERCTMGFSSVRVLYLECGIMVLPKASEGNTLYTPHEGYNSHTLQTH